MRTEQRPPIAAALDGMPDGRVDRPAVRGRQVVLLAPSRADDGNRAVLETMLETGAGPVDVVVGPDGQEPSALALPARASYRALPALLAGTKHERRTALVRVERLLRGADHCTVVAPDTISGRDDVDAFIRCIGLARAAAAAGVDSRVLGFAWGAGGACVPAMRAAVRAGVQLYVRDDVSMIRAANEGLSSLHHSADLAFAGDARDPAVLDDVDARGKPIAVVSVSATVTPGRDPAADYVAIVEHLQRRGAHAVLMPSRPDGFDLLLLSRVARACGGAVTALRRRLASAELRALTAAARLTVTDRTRTAVIALSGGSAVLGLAAHGELERLLRSTGLASCSLLPRPGFSGEVRRIADTILDDEAAIRRAVRRMLPGMRDLARASLDGQPGRPGGAASVRAAG